MYGGGNVQADDVGALVVDAGSLYIRAGHAGEDSPKVVVPSVSPTQEVGVIETPPSDPSAMDIDHPKRLIFGDSIMYRRDHMPIFPIFDCERGISHLVLNWDLFEQSLQYCLADRLMLDPKDHPCLFSDPNIHNREARVKLTELMFEKFQVPALYLVKNAVLASFAAGRSTSLVIDSGASTTYAVPIHDGLALNKGIIKFDVGGETITRMLLQEIEQVKHVQVRPRYTFRKNVRCTTDKAGEMQILPEFTLENREFPNTHPSFHRAAMLEIVRDLKETHCKVSDTAYSDASYQNIPTVPYEMPDGSQLELGSERFRIPELLFNCTGPLDNGSVGFVGVHQMAFDAITRCDMDIRKELYGNVVLAGGNTLFTGFTERLTKKLMDLSSQNIKVKLIASPSSIERKFSAWIGGSILASLSSFQQMWMSKREYEEHGAILVDRKCA